MIKLWFSKKVRQNASIVNIVWSTGLGALALFAANNAVGSTLRQWRRGMTARAWC